MISSPSTSDRSRRRLAWTAPVIVAGVVVAGVALSGGTASGASPTLPARSAAQLIAAVGNSTATSFSGRIDESANFGIPALPGGRDSASLSWQTFLSGTHTARVWVDGAARQRIALTGQLSEADVVHNGNDVWTYTSDTNTVTHNTLPAHTGQNGSTDGSTHTAPDATDTTPTAVATRLLKAIDPTTKVSVDATRRVAGRDAYTLVLAPRDSRSTVTKVTIAIDATRYVPLQVQVFGAGSGPAFSTGFTSISYTRPAASVFAFTPPAGATVSKDPLGLDRVHGDHHRPGATPAPSTPSSSPSGSPKTIGSGWTTIVELPTGGASRALTGSTLKDLTTAVGTDGTRLLHTALLNAVILPDGRVFAGAVSPALLEHVAATTH